VKKAILVCGLLTLIALALWILLQPGVAWLGIDEAVVNVVARQAGRAPRSPIINLARGDLEIFFLLAAGAIGGFVAGYYFRALFVGKVGVR
jgi:cobalt/nickel transport protein